MNNFHEIVRAIRKKHTELTIASAKDIIETVFDEIRKKVVEAEKPIQIRGFGSFSIKEMPARNSRNPKTGEPIMVPAKKKVKFKPSKADWGI